MLAYFISPYRHIHDEGAPARTLEFDRYTRDIDAVSGYWEESEIDGDRALVLARAPEALIKSIASETGWRVEEPEWTPTRTKPRASDGEVAFDTGQDVPTRPLEDLHFAVFSDERHDEFRREAENVIRLADQEGYVRLTQPHRHALPFLGYLARKGYGLDRVSTGTFPTTGILSTFTGADEDPIVTDFSGPLFDSEGQLRRVSNALRGDADGQASGSWYDGASYDADSEAFMTLTTKDTNVDSVTVVFARIAGPGTVGLDAYRFDAWVRTGTDEWQVRRVDNGSTSTLGATVSQEFASGDGMGIECIGDQISGYWKSGASAWALIGARTDATYSAGGFLGAEVFRNGVVGTIMDDFGGGTVVVADDEPGYSRRYGPAQLSAVAADLFTVPAGFSYEIRNVWMNNPTGSLRKVTLSIGDDAAGTRFLDLYDVPAGESVQGRRLTHQALVAGEKLQGYADAGSAVVLVIDGFLRGL